MKNASAPTQERLSRSDTTNRPLPVLPPPTVKQPKTHVPNDSAALGYLD